MLQLRALLKISCLTSETIRRIGRKCSQLKYHVPFPKSHETYKLIVFQEDPCGNKSIPALNVTIIVINCSCWTLMAVKTQYPLTT